MPLLPPERHGRILSLLTREGSVSVQQLADSLEVTRETVRRDLDQLESAGSLRRIHGGAVASGATSRTETSLQERLSRRSAQKQAIAAAAVQHLPPEDGGSVIIDAGTTTEALADRIAAAASPSAATPGQRDAGALPRAEDLALITTAVPIAHKLSSTGVLDVEILGGTIRGITGAAVGQQTVETLSRRRADVVFLGTNGVCDDFGLSTPDTAEAAVKTALIRAARKRVLLVDSSKLGETSLVRFGGLEELDVLITDAAPQPDLAEALEAAEVDVVIAPADQQAGEAA